MFTQDQQKGQSILRGVREAERIADELEPGIKHRIINTLALTLLHGEQVADEMVGQQLAELGIPPNKPRRNSVIYLDETHGGPLKVLLLRIHQSAARNAAISSGFSEPLCRKLGLDQKLFSGDWKGWAGYAHYHELGHLILPQAETPKTLPDRLLWDHKREMFADIFAVLQDVKAHGRRNIPTWETIMRCQFIRGLNRGIASDASTEEQERRLLSNTAHITAPGIRAAIVRAGREKSFSTRPLKDLVAMAHDLTDQYAFTAEELMDIYGDTKRAIGALAAKTSPCLVLERMQCALDVGALDPQKPWVKRTIEAWNGLTGQSIAQTPADPEARGASMRGITRKNPLESRERDSFKR